MKSNSLIILASIFMTFFLFGCETENSEDVNQDRIFVAYELFYDQPEDVTYAKVVFTLGNLTGTRLELSEGASITFDGTTIPFENVRGVYELKLSGLVNNGSFVYNDLDGEKFTNSITLRSVDFPSDVPTTINRSQSYEITWTGEPVGEGSSSVVATVVPNNLAQTKIFTQANSGATSVVLTPNILSDIEPQGGTLVLERFDIGDANQTTGAGGIITGRYRPDTADITIE